MNSGRKLWQFQVPGGRKGMWPLSCYLPKTTRIIQNCLFLVQHGNYFE
ncbi:polymorphic toxin type 46 domain-containing protein [Pseudomonas coronafaciens]|nr:polymorphic toxin type 46 domain-containing protein [Pseudomonas coronafaciens]